MQLWESSTSHTSCLFAAHQKHHPPPARPPFPAPTPQQSHPGPHWTKGVKMSPKSSPQASSHAQTNLHLSSMDQQHPPHPSKAGSAFPFLPQIPKQVSHPSWCHHPASQESKRKLCGDPMPQFPSQPCSSWSTQTHRHHLYTSNQLL